MRSLATFLAALLVACGPSWPGSVTSLAVAHAPHGSVDVLPLDLELWTAPGFDANVDELRSSAEARITNLALAALDHHAYGVASVLDWNGDFRGGHALARDELISTISTLARYTGEVAQPHLPVRLGAATGADATLYVGGWGYIANHPESTADKVAGSIAYGLVVIAEVLVVGLAIAALSSGHGHHDGEARHHGASRSRGLAEPVGRAAAEVAVDVFDTVGERAVTEALVEHPVWAEDPALPHDGGESKLFLEMTLVDNHTGSVLWHAHQGFPASLASAHDVDRAASALLATLPRG